MISIIFSNKHRSLFSNILSTFGLSEVGSLVSFHSPLEVDIKVASYRTLSFWEIKAVSLKRPYSRNSHNLRNIKTLKTTPPFGNTTSHSTWRTTIKQQNDLKWQELGIPLVKQWFSDFCGCNCFWLNENIWRLSNPTWSVQLTCIQIDFERLNYLIC